MRNLHSASPIWLDNVYGRTTDHQTLATLFLNAVLNVLLVLFALALFKVGVDSYFTLKEKGEVPFPIPEVELVTGEVWFDSFDKSNVLGQYRDL